VSELSKAQTSQLESRGIAPRILWWRMACSLFALFGMLIAFYLLLYDLGRSSLVCPIAGCELVQASPYSKWFGIPVAGFGLVYFLGLFGLAVHGLFSNVLLFFRVQDLLRFAALPGLVFYAYFTYLEAFVIHAWCFWCVTSSLMLLGFLMCALLERSDPARQVQV
jgi:uncharacterized membrane protein